MRTAFGSFGRGNARLATLGNAIEGHNVIAQFTVFTVSPNGTNPPFKWQARAAARSQRGHTRRTPAYEAPGHPAAQPRGRLRRSPFQRRQYHSSKVPQGAARAQGGATSAWRGCSMTQKHTRAYSEPQRKGGGYSTSHSLGGGEAARRRGGVRTAFGSFGRGNARLATLGNAIEGRNVTAHFTVNINGTKPPFGWQARAATRSQRGRPRRTPANEAPDRPAAQPRGRLRHSPFQRRQYHSSKVPQGAARAQAGTTSAWRRCSMTLKHTRA